jgi:hypothetical protein
MAELFDQFHAGPARSPAEIAQARALHTRTYVEANYIEHPGARPFDDGWMDRREWLVVADGQDVVGATSLIAPTHTLPSLEAFAIDPETDARIGPAWREGRVVEVSTLVRDRSVEPGVLVRALLYRALWMSAARRGDHDVWLMSMPFERLPKLAMLFPVPFEVLGTVEDHHRYHLAGVACVLDLRLARTAVRLRNAPLLDWLDARSPDFGLVTGPHRAGTSRMVPVGP